MLTQTLVGTPQLIPKELAKRDLPLENISILYIPANITPPNELCIIIEIIVLANPFEEMNVRRILIFTFDTLS